MQNMENVKSGSLLNSGTAKLSYGGRPSWPRWPRPPSPSYPRRCRGGGFEVCLLAPGQFFWSKTCWGCYYIYYIYYWADIFRSPVLYARAGVETFSSLVESKSRSSHLWIESWFKTKTRWGVETKTAKQYEFASRPIPCGYHYTFAQDRKGRFLKVYFQLELDASISPAFPFSFFSFLFLPGVEEPSSVSTYYKVLLSFK